MIPYSDFDYLKIAASKIFQSTPEDMKIEYKEVSIHDLNTDEIELIFLTRLILPCVNNAFIAHFLFNGQLKLQFSKDVQVMNEPNARIYEPLCFVDYFDCPPTQDIFICGYFFTSRHSSRISPYIQYGDNGGDTGGGGL